MAVGAVLGVLALIGGAWLWTPDKDRAELEAVYAAPPSRFVEAAGLRVHVRDTGPPSGAPVLVLLHGFASSLHTWEPWAQALSATHRVIRLDLPGAGLTGADPTGDYGDERGLQVIEATLDRLGVAHATFIGHSMGGRLAWRMAAEHPERVDRLVLVAPDGFASPGFAYGQAPSVPWAARLMQRVLPRPLVRMSLAPAYADPKALDEATLTRYHDMLLAPGVRPALIARMAQLVLQDPTPLLRRVRAPTLLLWGTRDAMIPPSNAQDYLRVMPDARLVTLPGVGHLPQEQAPAESLPPVLAFIDAAGPDPASR